MIDEALGAVGAQVQLPCDAAREAGAVVTTAGAASRPGRARGDRAPRRRDRRDGVERLPVDPLERRAGEGRRPRERAADRVGQGGRPREHARPRSTWRRSRSGSTPTPRSRRELADFYFKRFRAEFRPAVDAWVATRPLKNPNAPLTPFAMPQYKLAARAEAERLDARGRGLRRAGRAGTSSAHRTTCSASSSSPRRCSSPA